MSRHLNVADIEAFLWHHDVATADEITTALGAGRRDVIDALNDLRGRGRVVRHVPEDVAYWSIAA